MEADLQEYYQVRLSSLWSREETPRRIASLVAWLPRGARVWQMLGGRNAVTRETEAIMGLETTELSIAWSRGGRKGQQPTGRDFPLGVDEMNEKNTYVERNAAAWRRKYGNPKKR